jgi:hypothetical protein
MPRPPTNPPPRPDVKRVAELARIPVDEREPFCDDVGDTVEMVWKLNKRAVSSNSGDALVKAAEAARALHEAFDRLNPDDLKHVEQLWPLAIKRNKHIAVVTPWKGVAS